MYSTEIEISHEERLNLMRNFFKSPKFDSYTIHKLIYGQYPIDENAKFVFDAEYIDDNCQIIRSYSDKKPVITGLDNCRYHVKSINLDEQFKEGEAYEFAININPVKKKDSHCVLVRDWEINDWFEKKMNANGMSVEFENNFGEKFKAISVHRRYRRYTPTKTNQQGVPMHVAQIVGMLRILDIEKFKEALVNGIGREKAFGLGMLMMKKIH